MKLKEGMYIRTKEGIIDKVIIDYEGHCNSPRCNCKHVSCRYNYYDEDKIVKTSHNIIDLIEVGDVISTNNLCGQVTSIEGDKIYTTCYDGECCYDYQIQSIVTKEQFSSMEYRLGE